MKTKFQFITLLCLVISVSCNKEEIESNNDNSNSGQLTEYEQFALNYFDLPSATFTPSTPSPQGESPLSEVTISNYAIGGGVLFVSVEELGHYVQLLVSIEGQKGYFTTQASQNLELLVGQEMRGGLSLRVVGVDENGLYSLAQIVPIEFIDLEHEGLQVALSFDANKDLDLHLFLPNGEEIYYGNPGSISSLTGIMAYGLELTSNDDCKIDYIGNESIFIPERFLIEGTYRVCVNLYGNCDPFSVAQFCVRALYNGQRVETLGAENPYRGRFEVGDEQNRDPEHYLEVMKFSLSPTSTRGDNRENIVKMELSTTARAKLYSRQCSAL